MHGFFRLLQLLRPDDFPDESAFESGWIGPSRCRRARARRGASTSGACRRAWQRRSRPRPRRGRSAWHSSTPCARRPRPTRSGAGTRPTACGARSPRERRCARSWAGATRSCQRSRPRPHAADPRLAWLAARARDWRRPATRRSCSSPTARAWNGCARAQPAQPARDGRLPRGALDRAARHRGRAVPAGRGPEPAGLDRVRRRGPQLRVLPPARALRPAVEPARRRAAHRAPRSDRARAAGRGRLLPASRGLGRDAARLYESLGLFREPLAGLEPELARVESRPRARGALGRGLAVSGTLRVDRQRRPRGAVPDPRGGLARDAPRPVPGRAGGRDPGPGPARARRAQRGRGHSRLRAPAASRGSPRRPRLRRRAGNDALVDSLPGVPGGTSFLGSFDREEALDDERLDFFASGHPLVEGVMAHLEESPLGRVGVVHVAIGSASGRGLVAFYKDGPRFEAVAVDEAGRPRPEWAAALRTRPLRTRRIAPETLRVPGWAAAIRRMAAALDPTRRPVDARGPAWSGPDAATCRRWLSGPRRRSAWSSRGFPSRWRVVGVAERRRDRDAPFAADPHADDALLESRYHLRPPRAGTALSAGPGRTSCRTSVHSSACRCSGP